MAVGTHPIPSTWNRAGKQQDRRARSGSELNERGASKWTPAAPPTRTNKALKRDDENFPSDVAAALFPSSTSFPSESPFFFAFSSSIFSSFHRTALCVRVYGIRTVPALTVNYFAFRPRRKEDADTRREIQEQQRRQQPGELRNLTTGHSF